jgi:hypothetical protein
MSSPPVLSTPPLMSLTAMTFAPLACSSAAQTLPTLPKPCTTTRNPSIGISSSVSASCTQ